MVMNGGSAMPSDLQTFLRQLLYRFSKVVRKAVKSTVLAFGRWELRGYHREDLPEDWNDLPDEEKLAALDDLDPVVERETCNATTEGMHEIQAASLNPAQNNDQALTRLVVGTDGTSPSTTDSSLGDQVVSTDITESTTSGGTLIARGFLDTNQANGNLLKELGSKTHSGTLLNRGIIQDVDKTNALAVSLRVEITFTDG